MLDVAIDLCIRLREVYQKDIHNDLKGDGVLGHDCFGNANEKG